MRQECLVPSLLRRVSQPANLAMVGLVGVYSAYSRC